MDIAFHALREREIVNPTIENVDACEIQKKEVPWDVSREKEVSEELIHAALMGQGDKSRHMVRNDQLHVTICNLRRYVV